MLKEQAIAPDFKLIGSDGNTHELSTLKGKLVVLYFYPKDNTPGCTQEACDFRDNLEKINLSNCIVYGISKDSINSHTKFKESYHLNFVLLSDPELQVHKSYEVLQDNKTVRSTFLINQSGKIEKIWKKVSVKGHVEEVLKSIHALSKS